MSDSSFDRGVLWAVARIVEWYDEVSMAKYLLREGEIDLALVDEFDRPFIARAITGAAWLDGQRSRTESDDV